MRAVRLNRQAVWCALLAGLLLAMLGWSEPAPRRAAASETLPHPVLFPLLLNDSPLQDTSLLDEPFKGDLSALIERRLIRVLVTYDRTNFFLVDGAPRGFEYELVQQYQRYLKTRVRRRSWPVTFAFIPVSFDQLLPALEGGWGDIAAAGLTITPERQKRVAFTRPYIRDVKELVVTTAGADDGLRRLEDLAGRDVYVNGSTSYAAHLEDLSDRLTGQGLPPIEIVPADHKLADEDILELVDMGAVEATVVDSHLARFWSTIYPGLVVREDLALHEGGRIAWAVRKDSPELLQSLNESLGATGEGTLIGNVLLKRYFHDRRAVESPLRGAKSDRLTELEPLFRKYGEATAFDWLLLAAVAYQESKLDNDLRSPAGARGIMQIKPETAAAPPVSVPDVSSLDDNVRAGARYLAHLRDDYFADLAESPTEQLDFVLAAYNGGPTRLKILRAKAAKLGLDADRWFGGVERLARKELGRETVEYVAKVNKYYVAYRLARGSAHARALAISRERALPPRARLPAGAVPPKLGKGAVDLD
jgi:membrane-bound lytic murein transglycosylase MltF